MPKKIFYESAVHHFCMAAKDVIQDRFLEDKKKQIFFQKWISSFNFVYLGNKKIRVSWNYPKIGQAEFSFDKCNYYERGDKQLQKSYLLQNYLDNKVLNAIENKRIFTRILSTINY